MNNLSLEYLNKAKKQLEVNSNECFIYACLELRMCIEILAYEKLKSYKERIPEDIYSKWQPTKIIKILEELEPDSRFDKKINVTNFGNESKEFKQKEITSKFINDRYHKLGNYLHVPLTEKKQKKDKLKEYLESLVKELEPYVRNPVYSTFSKVNRFECTECKKYFIRNSNSIKVGDIVTCYNSDCKAEFFLEKKVENGYLIKLVEAEIECFNCKNMIYVPLYKLKDKNIISCLKCKNKYIIIKDFRMEKYDG
ncbi:MAG: hypothetical protein U5K55_02490 [Aliarcobacter sp.]|nr:hypothetical protein [Aliarcobacter sp.]